MGVMRGWIQWDIVNFVEFNVTDNSIEFCGVPEFEGRTEEGISRWESDELLRKSRLLDGLDDRLEKRQIQHNEQGNPEVCRTDRSHSRQHIYPPLGSWKSSAQPGPGFRESYDQLMRGIE